MMDAATVFAEGALFLVVLWPRAFRLMLAMLVMFHVGIFAMMGIFFWSNLVAYAVFVPWALVPGASRLSHHEFSVAGLLTRFHPLAILLIVVPTSICYVLFVGERTPAEWLGYALSANHQDARWLVGSVTCTVAAALVVLLMVPPGVRRLLSPAKA